MFGPNAKTRQIHFWRLSSPSINLHRSFPLARRNPPGLPRPQSPLPLRRFNQFPVSIALEDSSRRLKNYLFRYRFPFNASLPNISATENPLQCRRLNSGPRLSATSAGLLTNVPLSSTPLLSAPWAPLPSSDCPRSDVPWVTLTRRLSPCLIPVCCCPLSNCLQSIWPCFVLGSSVY